MRSRVSGRQAGDRATIIGLAVSAAWLILVAIFWLTGPSDSGASGLARLAAIVGVVLPLLLIWLAVGLARAIAELRAEATMLRARMEVLRPEERAAAERDAPIPSAPGRAATAALRPAPRATARPVETRQTDLPLEQPEPAVEVSPTELVLALNFPDGPDDHEAIAALKTALLDHELARSIRASQDVVTLLAQHGIYMDDLPPTRHDAAKWRRYLDGQRTGMSDLATIDDNAALETATTLMREDEVFRDVAHHFLRQYDRTLARAVGDMDDSLLTAAVETRSGRAFRLLAQVTGMFG